MADEVNEQERYYRRVIRITAHDSPNVSLGLAQRRRGKIPTDEVLIPNVITYRQFVHRTRTWDKIRKTIGLEAQFYEGAELLLYPPDWLDRAHEIDKELKKRKTPRKVVSIGCDPAAGGNQTAMYGVDQWGIVDKVAKKTPDTSYIPSELIAFAEKHQCKSNQVWMDSGGGGKQAADVLLHKKFKVNLVHFGAPIELPIKATRSGVNTRRSQRIEKHIYKNRRAQMYHCLHLCLDPGNEDWNNGQGFAIPEEYEVLREELAPIPLLYDREQRIRMLPKNKEDTESDEPNLTDLIGHSPDEADALVLAVYGMVLAPKKFVVTAR